MKQSVKDFSRCEVRAIALEYAFSEAEVSASYFCRAYGISEGVFYNVIKRAIVESMIDDNTAKVIGSKASNNSALHGGEGGRRQSIYKHERLMKKRGEFQFSFQDKATFAKEYATSPEYVDAKVFMAKHAMTCKLFERTIRSAIVDGCVSDEIARALMEKALQRNPSEKVVPFFEALFAERKAKQQAQKMHEAEVRMLRRQRKKKQKAEASRVHMEMEEKKKHREFVQMTMNDFGIPDELCEQCDSLGIKQDLENDEWKGWSEVNPLQKNGSEDSKQISFFD